MNRSDIGSFGKGGGVGARFELYRLNRFWDKLSGSLDGLPDGTYRNGYRCLIVDNADSDEWLMWSAEDPYGAKTTLQFKPSREGPDGLLTGTEVEEARYFESSDSLMIRSFTGNRTGLVEHGLTRREVLSRLIDISMLARPEYRQPIFSLDLSAVCEPTPSEVSEVIIDLR